MANDDIDKTITNGIWMTDGDCDERRLQWTTTMMDDDYDGQ
jgi:hypothetical protein